MNRARADATAGAAPRLARVAAALAIGFASAAFAYAVLRVTQLALFGEPNPLTDARSPRVAYFWRGGIALHFGGAVTIVLLATTQARSAPLGRLLAALVPIAAAAVLGQSLLFP